MSSGSESLVRCDQCKTPYKFRKSKFIGVLTNRYMLFIFTSLIFLGMVWSTGAMLNLAIDRSQDQALAPTSSRTTRGKANEGSIVKSDQSRISKMFNFFDSSDEYGDDYCGFMGCGIEDYSGVVGLMRVFGRLGTDNLNLMSTAVSKVIPTTEQDSKKPRMEWEEVWLDILESNRDGMKKFSEEYREIAWRESLIWEWKFGQGGIYEEYQDELIRQVVSDEKKRKAREDLERKKSEVENRDEKLEAEEEETFRVIGKTKRKIRRIAKDSVAGPSWVEKFTKQSESDLHRSLMRSFCLELTCLKSAFILSLTVTLGLSFVGITSLPFTTLGSFFNWGLTRSILRRSRRNRDNETSVSTVAAVFIVLAIVIGLSLTFYKVFQWVESKARRALSRAEDLVLDWQEG